MAIVKETKEILRGGAALVGSGFGLTDFITGGLSEGDVAAAIAGAVIFGLTSDVTAVETLEFEVSEFDGKPGRVEGDSTPRKADLMVGVNMKQMTVELLAAVYSTFKATAGAATASFDQITRELDPDLFTYNDNVFLIGKRKDKKLFILVIKKASSESPLDLSLSDGEDVTHLSEIIANYDLADIRATLTGALTAPYLLFIEATV